MFISHRMEEVFAIADRIAVLKDGRNSARSTEADAVRDEIVRMMVGRNGRESVSGSLASGRCGRAPHDSAALRAVDFGVAGTNVVGIDLTVYAGEVCGLAGLQGQGQTILLEGLFGLRRATGALDVGPSPRAVPPSRPGGRCRAGARARGSQGGGRAPRLHRAGQRDLAVLDRFTRATVIQRRLERVRARARHDRPRGPAGRPRADLRRTCRAETSRR